MLDITLPNCPPSILGCISYANSTVLGIGLIGLNVVKDSDLQSGHKRLGPQWGKKWSSFITEIIFQLKDCKYYCQNATINWHFSPSSMTGR